MGGSNRPSGTPDELSGGYGDPGDEEWVILDCEGRPSRSDHPGGPGGPDPGKLALIDGQ